MKRLLLIVGAALGCTAADRVAWKECSRTVAQAQVVPAVADAMMCGHDRDCLESAAQGRALESVEKIAACVDGKRDGSAD